MKLIVGLGNPGKEYDKTRHNIGFTILDKLRKEIGFEDFHQEKKFEADISIGTLAGQKVLLAKPLTFMNLSGESVSKIIQFYKIPLEDLVVVYDDVDLPLATLRLRKKGSAGTHNGMKSLIVSLGNEDFPRLRFGIESRGITSPEKQEMLSFVLSRFTEAENSSLKEGIQRAIQALKTIVESGLEKSMNLFNS